MFFGFKQSTLHIWLTQYEAGVDVWLNRPPILLRSHMEIYVRAGWF